MNNHESHITPKFTLLVNEYHIRPFTFIFHLTHCMQPLNVGIFQHYKHYHKNAIKNVITKFNLDYSVVQFCRNLI